MKVRIVHRAVLMKRYLKIALEIDLNADKWIEIVDFTKRQEVLG